MKNKVLFITTIILSIFGLIMIYSSSYVWASYKFNNAFKYAINQGIFLVLGIVLMLVVSKIDHQIYKKYSNKILAITLILLILVLIPGIGVVRNGSRSWFGIGSFGFQPSEIAKIAMIIFVSKYLSKYCSVTFVHLTSWNKPSSSFLPLSLLLIFSNSV